MHIGKTAGGDTGEGSHLQAKERGLRRNQPCPQLDLGLQPPALRGGSPCRSSRPAWVAFSQHPSKPAQQSSPCREEPSSTRGLQKEDSNITDSHFVSTNVIPALVNTTVNTNDSNSSLPSTTFPWALWDCERTPEDRP